MTITIQETGNVLKGIFSGRLDTAASVQASKDMQTLLDQANRAIEIDCSELEYISSSGMRILLTLLKEVKAKGGTLVIRHISEPIREIFTLTGFFNLFDIR